MKIAVTGASGFIGESICKYLVEKNFFVRGIGRFDNSQKIKSKYYEFVKIEFFNKETDFIKALHNIDIVIHSAAVMNNTSLIYSVNIEGTEQLVIQAKKNGVKKIIFLSSIKCIGEKTELGNCFTENSIEKPLSSYGKSKLFGEKIIKKYADSEFKYTILRLPLVYGPGVKGNVANLIKISKLGIPIPFIDTNNNKSILSIYNFLDLLHTCLNNNKSDNDTFLVSDGRDMSTTSFFSIIAKKFQKKLLINQLTNKFIFLIMSSSFINRRLNKMMNSLQVDISYTKAKLNWSPVITCEETFDRLSKNDLL